MASLTYKVFIILTAFLIRCTQADEFNLIGLPHTMLQHRRAGSSNQNFTTYKLHVPGSNSITIIEAVTAKSPSPITVESLAEGGEIDDHFTNRTFKGESDQTDEIKPTPSLLEKFLTEYNIRINSNLPPSDLVRNLTSTDLKSSHRINRNDGKYFQDRDPPIEIESNDSYESYYDNRKYQQHLSGSSDSAGSSYYSQPQQQQHPHSPSMMDMQHYQHIGDNNRPSTGYNNIQSPPKPMLGNNYNQIESDAKPTAYPSGATSENTGYSANYNSYNNQKYNVKDGEKKWERLQPVYWSKSQVLRWDPNKKQQSSHPSSSSNYNHNYVDRNGYGDTSSIRRKWTANPADSSESGGYGYSNRDYLNFNNNIMDQSTEKYGSSSYRDRWSSNPKPFKSGYDRYDPRPEIEVSSNYDRYYDYGHRPALGSGADSYDHDRSHYRNPFSATAYSNNYNDDYEGEASHQYSITSPYNVRRVRPQYQYHGSDYSYEDTQNRNSYMKDRRHPEMSSGNGKWVLLTSNKAYEKPIRSHRYNSTRYTEHTNSSGSGPSASSSPLSTSQAVLNVIEKNSAAAPVTNFRTHKSVKLVVLPSENNRTMASSHNGLLEVDSSPETVESSASQFDRKKVKRRTMKLIPLHNAYNDKSAVLAAVGAGMVPATIAMLMPMALGRKRRSLSSPPPTQNQRNETFIDENNNHIDLRPAIVLNEAQ